MTQEHYALRHFITESNYLDGMFEEFGQPMVSAYHALMRKETLTSADLSVLGQHYEPGVVPTNMQGINNLLYEINTGLKVVRGMEQIADTDDDVVRQSSTRRDTSGQRAWLAYISHRAFMELQPFSGANGVLGRALWLYVMGGKVRQAFLTEWYLQSLTFGGVAEVEKK